MNSFNNILPTILYGLFMIAFLVHVFSIGYSLKHPDHPSVMTSIQDLKDFQFPIVLKICIQEMENIYDRYKKIGYTKENELFSGKSRFSNETYGWNGHNKNNTSLFSSVNGMYCSIAYMYILDF